MSTRQVQTILEPLRQALASGRVEAITDAVAGLSGDGRALLASYLGADEVERMRRRARRGRAERLGRVVLTHGIRGSELSSVDASGDADWIRVNLVRLAMGRIRDLRMDRKATGQTIRVDGLRVEYLPLLVELASRWDVLPFAVGADVRLSQFLQSCRPGNEPCEQPEDVAKTRASVAVVDLRHRRQGGSFLYRQQQT